MDAAATAPSQQEQEEEETTPRRSSRARKARVIEDWGQQPRARKQRRSKAPEDTSDDEEDDEVELAETVETAAAELCRRDALVLAGWTSDASENDMLFKNDHNTYYSQATLTREDDDDDDLEAVAAVADAARVWPWRPRSPLTLSIGQVVCTWATSNVPLVVVGIFRRRRSEHLNAKLLRYTGDPAAVPQLSELPQSPGVALPSPLLAEEGKTFTRQLTDLTFVSSITDPLWSDPSTFRGLVKASLPRRRSLPAEPSQKSSTGKKRGRPSLSVPKAATAAAVPAQQPSADLAGVQMKIAADRSLQDTISRAISSVTSRSPGGTVATMAEQLIQAQQTWMHEVSRDLPISAASATVAAPAITAPTPQTTLEYRKAAAQKRKEMASLFKELFGGGQQQPQPPQSTSDASTSTTADASSTETLSATAETMEEAQHQGRAPQPLKEEDEDH